jgi:hypothetical protein
MERQSLLARPRAPHLIAVLNEAVLRRPVGGAAVMAEQLGHLLEISQQAGVRVRILPWSSGAHGGMGAANSFTLLDFPDDPMSREPMEPPLVYVDTLTGAMYLNKADEVSAYRRVWADLEQRALDEAASRRMITEAMEGLRDA